MMQLNTPGQRAGFLAIVVLASALLDLVAATVVGAFYSENFAHAYMHALVGSVALFLLLLHWSATLSVIALIIAYQLNQSGNSSADIASYVGGALAIGVPLTVIDFVWASTKTTRRGYLSLQDALQPYDQ